MRRLLKLALFLMPVFILPLKVNLVHVNMRDARELLFESFAIIFLGRIIKNSWLEIFFCWAVMTWWFHFFLPQQSTAVLFNMAMAGMVFYAIKTYVKEDAIDGILKLICITALFQVLWLGVQGLGKDFIFFAKSAIGDERLIGVKTPLTGWLGNKNILAVYLALCLPLFRVYFKWLIPFVILGLFIANSSVAITAAFCGVMFFEICLAVNEKNSKRLQTCVAVILIALVILFGFFVFVDKPGFERIIIWKQVIVQTFNWKSIIGRGLGEFQNLRILDKTGTMWDNPHNEYIQVYFELGLIGIFLILGYFTNLFIRFFRFFKGKKETLLASCVIVLLVSCVGMFPMQIAPTALLGITYVALLEGLCQRRSRVLLMT